MGGQTGQARVPVKLDEHVEVVMPRRNCNGRKRTRAIGESWARAELLAVSELVDRKELVSRNKVRSVCKITPEGIVADFRNGEGRSFSAEPENVGTAAKPPMGWLRR